MTDANDHDNDTSPEDEVDDEFVEPELSDVLDDEELGDELEDIDEDVLEGDDVFADDTDDALDVTDEEDTATAEVDPPRPRRTGTGADDKEDEDEEELDPDDVEADLDTILKDRLEAYDESGDDEEEEEVTATVAEEGDLPSKKEGEFPCPSCFLLVSAKQVARTGYCPHCGDPISVPAGLSSPPAPTTPGPRHHPRTAPGADARVVVAP